MKGFQTTEAKSFCKKAGKLNKHTICFTPTTKPDNDTGS